MKQTIPYKELLWISGKTNLSCKINKKVVFILGYWDEIPDLDTLKLLSKLINHQIGLKFGPKIQNGGGKLL